MASNTGAATAREIRARLDHPVIDADGHWLEFGPVFLDYLEKVAGKRAADGLRLRNAHVSKALSFSLEERLLSRRAQEAWWVFPTRNTLDRATATLPRLLAERLDDFGIDFTVLYPTTALGLPFLPDDEMRRAACRAFNMFVADYFGEFSDRMTPAAAIPMHTPEEAIDELEHAVKTLGLKVALMASLVRRPIAALGDKSSAGTPHARWYDMIGLDSAYDYDPLWAKCVELGVSPTFHSASRGLGLRASPSNFVYNHIGHFAAANEAVCKAVFLGGVTRRFPGLKFGFLEGGVGWACSLYSDLIGHWKKRNLKALEEVNPANLDCDLFEDLMRRYGGKWTEGRTGFLEGLLVADGSYATGGLKQLDDFSACKIARAEDIQDLFVPNFYFGCEADDPLNAWAFNRRTNPFGAKLNVLFGSDIGHFDVPDMKDVLGEAYELVEDGLIDESDLRDFLFVNPARFYAESNPRFFAGTRVESETRAIFSGAKSQDHRAKP